MSIGINVNFYNLSIINMMEFSDWITKKFLEWRGDRFGQSASIAEFAKLFSASHQLVSEWMKKSGKVPTSVKYITALVNVYGEEVYGVLGLPRPDLSPVNARLLLEASRDLSRSVKDTGIDINSAAFEKLAMEIFSRHGIKLERTD